MAFGKRASVQEVPEVEQEDGFDVLSLTRLTNHPSIAGLMERKEALHKRHSELAAQHQHLQAVERDYSTTHTLALAEADAEVMLKLKTIKTEVQDASDQLALVEAGIAELNAQIDSSAAEVREAIQQEIDTLFLKPVEQMLTGLTALKDANNRLHELERAGHRLLQSGRLACYGAGLDGWIHRLERKLRLIQPR